MATIPPPGLDLIQQFEGCRLEAYPDPLTGGAPYTIGWGSTRRQDGTPWQPGDRISQQAADELLQWHVEQHFLPALQQIPGWSTFNAHQAGAILSFAYNLGADFYGAEDFQTISRVLRERDWPNLEFALSRYRNPGSPVEEGLLRRRLTEAKVFLAGTPQTSLSPAGATYLDTTVRTYHQSPDLSDQAQQYLAAIAPTVPGPLPTPTGTGTWRELSLQEPPLVGEDVRQVQEALVKAGATLAVDGMFGTATQQAVAWFQRLSGLAETAVVDEATRSLLFQRSLHLTTPLLIGADVKELQQTLISHGFIVEPDGTFGPATAAAVEAFQRGAGLFVDGIVGSHTRRILNARVLSLSLPYLQGKDVLWLQKALTRSGLPVTPDGSFGPATEWMVKRFQAVNHLLADGIVGPKTWVKLGF